LPSIRWGLADLTIPYASVGYADTIFRASKPVPGTHAWRAEYLDDRAGFYNAGQYDGSIAAQRHALSRARHVNPLGACVVGNAPVGATFVTAPTCGLVTITVGGSLRIDGWQGGQSVDIPADEAYYGYTTDVTDAAGNTAAALFRKLLVNTVSPFSTGLGIPGTVTAAGFNIAATFADSAEIAASLSVPELRRHRRGRHAGLGPLQPHRGWHDLRQRHHVAVRRHAEPEHRCAVCALG
jgi:hypothetical protein